MKFSEKVIVITGASRSIGFALSEEFLKQGAKLSLCGSRPETAELAAKKLRAFYPNADILALGVNVGDSKSVSHMVESVITPLGASQKSVTLWERTPISPRTTRPLPRDVFSPWMATWCYNP